MARAGLRTAARALDLHGARLGAAAGAFEVDGGHSLAVVEGDRQGHLDRARLPVRVAETRFRSAIEKSSLGRSFLNNPPWNLRIALLPLAFWTPKCQQTVLFTCDPTCRRGMVLHKVVWRLGARVTLLFPALAAPLGNHQSVENRSFGSPALSY